MILGSRIKAFETAQIHRFVWPFQALSIIYFGAEEIGEVEGGREGLREREREESDTMPCGLSNYSLVVHLT